MNLHWIAIAGCAFLTPGASGQSESSAPDVQTPTVDVRARVGDLPGHESRKLPAFDPETCAQVLTGADLSERERVFGELVERAGIDPKVEDAMRRWAYEGSERELAWTARLVLRELKGQRSRKRRAESRSEEPFAGLDLRVNGMPPGTRLLIPRGPSARKSGARLERTSSRTFRVEAGPSGVRIEMRDASDGRPDELQTFEAPTMAQLLIQHPEIAEDLGSVWFSPEQTVGDPNPAGRGAPMRFTFDALWGDDVRTLRTDVLGVDMFELDASALFLEGEAAHTGLLVERVAPGTIAEALALRRGDVLLELNGVALRRGDDVSRVVQGRAADAALVVKLVRNNCEQVVTWRPSLPGGPVPDLPAPAEQTASPDGE